ncbi:MAG: efflux RND transporter periplasmic adaptor subunit [Desulfosarcinaceae bacterium]|jgi:HlyD family secretion protein
MKKRMFLLVILVAAVAAGVYGKRWYQQKNEPGGKGSLHIYGTIEIRDANLAFNEQERVAAVLVEEGQRVATGQVLARQTTDRLEAAIAQIRGKIGAQQAVVDRLKAGSRPQEIAQARAEVEAARIRVANAENVMARLRQTSKTGATSKQDLDDALANLKVAQAHLKVRQKALDLVREGPRKEDIVSAEHQLEALAAELKLLHIRLDDRTLTAPAVGVVQSRLLEPGELAGPNRPVLTLALTDPKWVRAYVPEPELGALHLGMPAQVKSDSSPEKPVEGWVGYVSPVAEFTPRTVQTEELRTQLVYETRVYVHDSDDRLRLGMPVTVIIDRQAEGSDKPAAPKTTSGG